MSRLTPWVAEAVGDVKTLAHGWNWAMTVQIAKAAVGSAVGTVKGDEDAPPLPTAWARTPFAVAVRDVTQSALLRPTLRAEVALESHGTEQLAGVRGPAIVVANHASHLDVGAVLATLPDFWRNRTAVALTSDAFFHTWWKAGAAALAYNTFQLPEAEPSDDGSTRFDVGPLVSVLSSGWSVLVFPEGGRTRDGIIQPFHPAVAQAATTLGVPVVPVGIRGAFTAMPQGTRWPRKGRPRVAVRYGAALQAQPAESAEVLTARMHRAVADLITEDSSTWWQVQRGARLPAVPDARWRRIWQQSEEPVAGGRTRHKRIWRS